MSENKRKPKTKEIDLIKEQLQMYEQMPEQIMVIKGWNEEELNVELSRLRTLIENSNRGKASRRKGASYENTIAKKFKEAFNLTLVRTPMSGGFQKSSDSEDFRGDINSIDPKIKFNLHLECKKHQKWSMGKWWKQAEEDCPEGRVPMLVVHRFQKNVEGKRVETAEDFVMLKLSDFMRIVDKEKIIEQKEGILHVNEAHVETGVRTRNKGKIEERRVSSNSGRSKRSIIRKSRDSR